MGSERSSAGQDTSRRARSWIWLPLIEPERKPHRLKLASEGEMSDATRAYRGSWPKFYDRLLVPVLFEPYARLLAGRLQGMTSGNVLEIAAGTGVVTRELIRTLPEAVGITATDLNQPMLDRAQSYAGAKRVRWQQADALALPFGDSSFECIVCHFGVMFFADKQAAFREALRVLKPDGPFLFSLWDGREENT